MRDDIHKSAPVPQHWKKVMRLCAREADRGPRAQASVVAALLADVHQELSSTFISSLLAVVTPEQGGLFANRERIDSAVDLAGDGSVLEEQVVESINRHFESEGRNKAAMLRALGEVLLERIEARDRAMTGHWLKCGDAHAHAAIQAMKSAASAINVNQITARIVEQDRPLTPKTSTGQLDLDEDLLSSR